MESEADIKDSRINLSNDLESAQRVNAPESALQAARLAERSVRGVAEQQRHPSVATLPSSETDTQHRFLTYVFARSARHTLLGIPNPTCSAIDPSPNAFEVPAFQIPEGAEARIAATL
jgi:hypothetical protein